MVRIVKETRISETTTSYKVEVDRVDQDAYTGATEECSQHREHIEDPETGTAEAQITPSS